MTRDAALELVVQTLRTANTFLRVSRRMFRPYGLTEVQFNVLNILATHGPATGGLSQREIGDILVVDRSNVTGLLDRMQRLGWIKREDVPGDRRAYRVSMTAKGRRLLEQVRPLYERAAVQTAAAIGAGRVTATLEALRELEETAASVARGQAAD